MQYDKCQGENIKQERNIGIVEGMCCNFRYGGHGRFQCKDVIWGRSEGEGHMDIWEKCIPGRRNSQCTERWFHWCLKTSNGGQVWLERIE